MLISLIVFVVDTVNVGGGVVVGWGGKNDFFASSVDVGLGFSLGKEGTSGFANYISTTITPLNVFGFHFRE